MLKILYLTIFVLLASCSSTGRFPSSLKDSYIDIVFDIDWTITSETDADFIGKNSLLVEGKKYVVQDGVSETIEDLLQNKLVRISFYSGGSSSRNHSLLKQIKLKDGKTLESIAYKILNSDDLVRVPGTKDTEKFSIRFKKDLTKINPDLKNLVMIDDNEHFLLNIEQEEHLIYLGKTFKHFEKFEDAVAESGEYIPRTKSEWSFARKKLFVVHGALLKALENKKDGLSDAVAAEVTNMRLESSDWNDYTRMLYARSLGHLTAQTPECTGLFKQFIDSL